jgi:hypothetical protein
MFKSYCGVPRMHLSLSLRLSVFLCLSLLESGLEALVGRWRSGYCLYIPVTVGGEASSIHTPQLWTAVPAVRPQRRPMRMRERRTASAEP